MSRRAVAALLAFLVLVAPEAALADDLLNEHVVVETPGSDLRVPKVDGAWRFFGLPVGTHVLAPPAWERLDVEFRRLQERETRLAAENDSFRKTMKDWQPGWKVALGILLVGLVAGTYVGTRF